DPAGFGLFVATPSHPHDDLQGTSVTSVKTPRLVPYSRRTPGNRPAPSGSLGGGGVNNSERNEHDEPSPHEGQRTARASPAGRSRGSCGRGDRTRPGAGGRGSADAPPRARAGEARAQHPARAGDRSERGDRASARGRRL